MKLWKYNSLLLIFSITLVICSTTDRLTKSTKKDDKKALNRIDKQYKDLDVAVGKELHKETANTVSSVNDLTTEKSFSELSSKNVGKPVASAFKEKLEINDLFKHTDSVIIKDLTKYEKCKLKQGIINLVIEIDKKKNLLITNPVNLAISDTSINIYTTENKNSLFFTANLDEVSKITQKFKGTNCFDIVVNRVKTKVNLVEKDKLILCGKDYKDWINAINEFKKCSIKTIIPNNQVKYITKNGVKDIIKISRNSNIVADFNKVNTFIKEKKRPLSISDSYKLSNNEHVSDDLNLLWYDNTCKSNTRSPIKQAEDSQMENQITKIFDVIKKGHIAEQQAKRKFKDKLDEVKKETKLLERKKEMMERAIQKKELEEKERIELINNNKKKFEEVQLLKAVTQKLKSMKSKQIKNAQKRINKEIKLEKEKANLNAQAVMKLVDKKDKLLDYSQCITERLLSFTDTSYINETCVNLFGKAKGDLCKQKNNFCTMCCEFHIGFKHLDKRIECKDKCASLVEGNKIQVKNLKKGKKIK